MTKTRLETLAARNGYTLAIYEHGAFILTHGVVILDKNRRAVWESLFYSAAEAERVGRGRFEDIAGAERGDVPGWADHTQSRADVSSRALRYLVSQHGNSDAAVAVDVLLDNLSAFSLAHLCNLIATPAGRGEAKAWADQDAHQ